MYKGVDRIDDKLTVSSHVNQMDDNVIELPIELTNATGTKIQSINEDCLLEIFSNDSLTPTDLCSLAETCTRFKQITQRIFPKGLVINGQRPRFKFKSKNNLTSRETESHAQRILKNFGSCISTLSICRMLDVDSVAKYCEAGTLKRLELRRIEGSGSFADALKPIFQQLQKLHIIQTPIECSNNVFANCDSLTELEITSTRKCLAILENTFPKLKRFSIISKILDWEFGNINEFTDIDTLFRFIGRHERLRTLTLNTNCAYTSRNLTYVIENCNELEELTLRDIYSYEISSEFSKLQNLTKLKMLDVNVDSIHEQQLVALLQALKSLEIVKLSHMAMNEIDSVLLCLSRLQNLSELHLIKCKRGNNFPISWTMLSRLKTFHIVDSLFFAERYINEIFNQMEHLEELIIAYSEDTVTTVRGQFSEESVWTLNCAQKGKIQIKKKDKKK